MQVGTKDVKNRGLEESMFVKMFNMKNGLTGDRAMNVGGVRGMLEKKFGPEASVKAIKYAGMPYTQSLEPKKVLRYTVHASLEPVIPIRG